MLWIPKLQGGLQTTIKITSKNFIDSYYTQPEAYASLPNPEQEGSVAEVTIKYMPSLAMPCQLHLTGHFPPALS